VASSHTTQKTPSGWNYDVDQHGNRVPKGNRVTNPDGSWREEVKQGKRPEKIMPGAQPATGD
jgi:hypothetical protein